MRKKSGTPAQFAVRGEFRGHEWTATWDEVARVRSAWSRPIVTHAWRVVWQRQYVNLTEAPPWDGVPDSDHWHEVLQPLVERQYGPPPPRRYHEPRA